MSGNLLTREQWRAIDHAEGRWRRWRKRVAWVVGVVLFVTIVSRWPDHGGEYPVWADQRTPEGQHYHSAEIEAFTARLFKPGEKERLPNMMQAIYDRSLACHTPIAEVRFEDIGNDKPC